MRLLDLFCGEGLAALGYWQSGLFDEIVGVDIAPMRYPFRFIQADAMSLDYDFLMQFDFVHASPPCQHYSKATPKGNRDKHPALINRVHHMLYATGLHYVIENVEGSGRELRPNVVLSGAAVGLLIHRVRYFHVSWAATPYRDIRNSGSGIKVHGGSLAKAELARVMGVDAHLGFSVRGMEQGIPPAFTRWIADRYMRSCSL